MEGIVKLQGIAFKKGRVLSAEDVVALARAGKAAGMSVVVVPLPGAPSSAGAAEVADVVLESLDELPLAAR